jgi:hypothetical protein
MIDLAEIEAKARAATQGEWAVNPTLAQIDAFESSPVPVCQMLWPTELRSEAQTFANAAYIAAAQPSVVLELIERVRAAEAKVPEPVVATHRHKRRGSEYVLIGFGKMQAEDWREVSSVGAPDKFSRPVDMREVAIYRSVDDGSLWARPREEFEDGRFERIRAAESAKAAEPVAWVPTRALEKLAADGAHIGVQTVIYACERSSFHPLYAVPVDVSALQERVRVLEEALQKIERWFGEFPPTGRTWPDGTPTSYAAEYGSNGERDFMRSVARKALGDGNE